MISIIIPIYNAEKSLRKCLISLQNQTYKDIEVIMVDDGSTDDSSNICKNFAKVDDRFVYISQVNSGVSTARNNGIKISKGEYVGFCDADDWVEADMFEKLYNNLVEYNADVSICSSYNDFPDRVDDEETKDTTVKILNSKQAIETMHLGWDFAGQLWNKLIKKELLIGVELDKEITIYEDMVYLWTVFNKSQVIVFENIKKYHYIQNSNSALHNYKESFWSVQKACDIMLNNMQTHYSDSLFYAHRTALKGNVLLAERLSYVKKLNVENYKKIKVKILQCYNKKSLATFPRMYKIKVKCLKNSRILFNILLKINRLIKS